jgi:hypothetical protein
MSDKEFFGDGTEEDEEDIVDIQPAEAEEVTGGNVPRGRQSDGKLVKPVEDIDEAAQVYEQFSEVKKKLLDKNEDTTKIGSGRHINKSGWRKIATAFSLSVEVVDKERSIRTYQGDMDINVVCYDATAVAVAPNGKRVEGTGSCASNETNFMENLGEDPSDEKKNKPEAFVLDGKWRRLKPPFAVDEHDIMATAVTRAKNRAISDMVGGGELSSEEIKAQFTGQA